MSESALIRVEHLTRYYGQHCALHDVSFTVGRGEVLGLLGPNGAGKSTTMQILSGNLAPSAGAVWINGIDLLDRPKAAKASLGYLPDQPPLYRELTVDEFLSYCARLHRIAPGQRSAAIQTAKQRCGLGEVGRRLIGNLSKGFQQRVGIAQAIIHAPPVVILDEPTVGLDPLQMREIRALIRELRDERSVLAVELLILAYFFLIGLDNYVALQPRLAAVAGAPGVTDLVAAPLFGNASIFLLFAVPMMTMRLVSEERRAQTLTLLFSAPVSMSEVVLGKFLGVVAFFLILLVMITLLPL